MRILCLIGIVIATIGIAHGQTSDKELGARRFWNDQDAAAIKALLEEGFETDWNNHQPAAAAAPDKCMDDAIFINTSGGWLIGREKWAELITRLHAAGGPFHDHTRRHAVEELRFLRADVALAVVKTFDIRRGGVPTSGEETRGLIILSKENGHWKAEATENTRIQQNPVGNR